MSCIINSSNQMFLIYHFHKLPLLNYFMRRRMESNLVLIFNELIRKYATGLYSNKRTHLQWTLFVTRQLQILDYEMEKEGKTKFKHWLTKTKVSVYIFTDWSFGKKYFITM